MDTSRINTNINIDQSILQSSDNYGSFTNPGNYSGIDVS